MGRDSQSRGRRVAVYTGILAACLTGEHPDVPQDMLSSGALRHPGPRQDDRRSASADVGHEDVAVLREEGVRRVQAQPQRLHEVLELAPVDAAVRPSELHHHAAEEDELAVAGGPRGQEEQLLLREVDLEELGADPRTPISCVASRMGSVRFKKYE